jgi:hypothetical protein
MCLVIYGFFAVFSLLFMLYEGSCVVYYVTFLIVFNIAVRAMLPLWRRFFRGILVFTGCSLYRDS